MPTYPIGRLAREKYKRPAVAQWAVEHTGHHLTFALNVTITIGIIAIIPQVRAPEVSRQLYPKCWLLAQVSTQTHIDGHY